METHLILKSLKLSYFKGIKKLDVNFGPEENFIYGKNEAGKTTVFDAVLFVFFGKDSTGSAKFSIKTYDKNNKVIENVDHEVEAVFEINGQNKSFKRKYVEIFDTETKRLTGHTFKYEVDGYPVRTEGDYNKEVGSYFKEETFKLLTNPLFFNSLKPNEMRNTLISLMPEISTVDIFASFPSKKRKSDSVVKLEALLTEGKTLDQIKAKVAADIKNLKELKEVIPVQIQEAELSKPVTYEFEELEELIAEKKADLDRIDGEILEANNTANKANKAIQEAQNQIFGLKTQLQKLEFQAEQDLTKWKNEQEKYPSELKAKIKDLKEVLAETEQELANKKDGLKKTQDKIENLKQIITGWEADKAKLVEDWKIENAKTFTWDGTTCSACKRPLEGAQALDAEDKARTNFNKAKAANLKEIEDKGTALKAKITEAQQEIKGYEEYKIRYQAKIDAAEIKIGGTKEEITTHESALTEHISTPGEGKTKDDFLVSEAAEIQIKITEMDNSKPKETKPDNSALIDEKRTVQTALENLQKALGHKETIAKTDLRIQELGQKEKDLAIQITEAKGMDDACFTFSKTRVEMIESSLNAKFELVSFKMFETILNGNEKEICECLYKGVPFQDLNTAGKIQAGLDIINTLSKHYGLYLPVFIDNRESVTWIPEMESQLINMVVDPSKDKLEIVSHRLELASV